jgi:hypothetical protein
MAQTNEDGTRTSEREALKALQDWSKWMVAIQTAVIALGTDNVVASLLWWVVLCFALSMIAGTILVGAIPSLLERPGDVWPSATFCWCPVSGIYRYKQFIFPLLAYAFVEHLFFVVGVIIFAISVCLGKSCSVVIIHSPPAFF